MSDERIYGPGDQPEGAETDCPNCGNDAIVNDEGIVCSNPDCPNN